MLSAHSLPRSAARNVNGAALVIVLAFVVLLTGLMVAFFARAVTSRQLSNSSAGQTRAEILAKSAADIVVAGFKKEIVSGSIATTVGSGSTASTIYMPSPPPTGSPAGIYMVPVRYPLPAAGTDPIPNLVRESVSGDSGNNALPTPGTPSLASAVNSSANAAIGGRSITPARWNSHYLIPCFDAQAGAGAGGATAAPSTPDAAAKFTAPDWVLVSRSGPAVQTGVGSGAGALSNAASANQNYVIGRYAYAVYDEGGLLDMNVAGHPTPTTTGFTSTQVSRKGSLALADLTQLPIDNNSPPTAYLTQATIDQIVGWRNYGSAGLSGNYPSFTFTATQTASWFKNFADNNATGFLSVYKAASGTTGPTDQAFLSRRELLRLQSSMGFSANALQYMGTFSRSREQPSFVPAHILYPDSSTAPAPSVNQVSANVVPGAGDVNNYRGNNDAEGMSGSSSAQDVINPSFLTVRVPTTITNGRNDGSDLKQGEPLVKKRFSLQRLSWLTYKGPSANNLTDSNVTQLITAMGGNPADPTDPIYKLVAQGNGSNITKYFGLSWSTGSGPTDPPGWTYNHGAGYIMNLSQVAAAGREPDFAELLKAAINVGSLAKGGPNLHDDQGNYQYVLDTSIDYNVLQILANLVDQYDLDGYPTIIKFAFGGVTRLVRGVEDLPYFYRYHPMIVVSKLPIPYLTSSNTVTFSDASGNVVETDSPCAPLSTSVTPDPGKAVFLYVPDVWNPHDPSVTLSNPNAPRPSTFRLAVISADPQGAGVWSPYVMPTYKNTGMTLTVTTPMPPTQDNAMPLGSESATAFTFSDNGGQLFREPTLLYRADAPTGANLGIDSGDSGSLAGPYTDAFTNVVYYGVQIASTPLSFIGTLPAGYVGAPTSTSGMYVFQTSQYSLQQSVPPNDFAQYTFRLQYKDPNGTGKWVTYDEKYPDFHGLTPPSLIMSKQTTNDAYLNFYNIGEMRDSSTGYDPRTARYGIGTQANLGQVTSAFEEPGAYGNENAGSQNGNDTFSKVKPTIVTTQRPGSDRGDEVGYSNPGMTADANGGSNAQMRIFSGGGWSAANGLTGAPNEYDGLFAQNDARLILKARDGNTNVHLYYEDADGMNRRAMAAYALQSSTSAIPETYNSTNQQTLTNQEGLPHAIAQRYKPLSYGLGTATVQSLSRPVVLNRPFRNVGEMSYASRGGIWKQIDFFTPESGDTALLDVFCVADSSVETVAAGKVNLNTHQAPVLTAIIAGAVRDELYNLTTPPSYKLSPLTVDEANAAAAKLVGITTDRTNAWRGPLANIGDLVGHYVSTTPSTTPGFTDFYSYPQPSTDANARTLSYAGFSAALDGSVYSASAITSSGTTSLVPAGETVAYTTADNYKIQRMRESAIRALADSGQTRVWNLMIDVVAQSGHYAPNAGTLAQFSAEGESRYWVHVAIDRYTGEIIDKQIELVTE